MTKRACLLLFALASLVVPLAAHAQDLPSGKAQWTWETAVMRSTNAASVVQQKYWAAAQGASGFADSLAWRRGATTATVYDTSIAYNLSRFAWPASFSAAVLTAQDTGIVWVKVRVRQDTTSYSFAGTTGLGLAPDSVRVTAEYSYDAINWFGCAGTPTYRFDTVFLTSSAVDGRQYPTLIGVEGIAGEDAVEIPLKCRPELVGAQSYILNQSLCVAGNYVRFIIGGFYSGQMRLELGHWEKD